MPGSQCKGPDQTWSAAIAATQALAWLQEGSGSWSPAEVSAHQGAQLSSLRGKLVQQAAQVCRWEGCWAARAAAGLVPAACHWATWGGGRAASAWPAEACSPEAPAPAAAQPSPARLTYITYSSTPLHLPHCNRPRRAMDPPSQSYGRGSRPAAKSGPDARRGVSAAPAGGGA